RRSPEAAGENPYRPPSAAIEVPSPRPEPNRGGSTAHDRRRARLGAEVFLRAVGLVNVLGAAGDGVTLIGTLMAVGWMNKVGFDPGPVVMVPYYLQRFLFTPACFGLHAALGSGLSRRRRWAPRAQAALSGGVLLFALLAFLSRGLQAGPAWK